MRMIMSHKIFMGLEIDDDIVDLTTHKLQTHIGPFRWSTFGLNQVHFFITTSML